MEKHVFQNTLFELLFKNLGTCVQKKYGSHNYW